MSKISTITAQVRDRVGKGAARAVRRAGRVPAVIYGNKQESLAISLEPRELHRHLHSAGFFTRLFDIAVGNDSHRVLARDVQLHPVSDRPLHVDFMRVGADATLHVQVPVHFVNQEKCPGLRIGGVLNIVRHEVELICNVNDIPEAIVIDLLPYQIGDSIHISMVTIPEGARPAIADRDFTIATIAPPTVAVDAATAA